MDTIKIRKKNTLLIAHRGLSGLEKENTIASFIAASNRSYFGLECDIHKTKDGKYVVCHDDDLKRVSGESVIIKDNDVKTLQSVLLIDNFDNEKKSYYFIPTLKEYIEICKKYDKHCIIEFKGDFPKNDVLEVIDEIKSLDYLEKVIFISFYPNPLIYTREALPAQDIQLLIFEYSDKVYEFCKKYKLGLDSRFDLLNKDIIDKWHSMNQRVNAWTVNDKKEAKRLIDLGIDYITTNILE
ncbi:MAG: glycerophosphodiester phosphodiesterase [Bacilli bacterium]|nr:glycerophosphodiester phosphodiesterase [Bacilli bacterium]